MPGKDKKLPWDEYWRLVLKLYSNAGGTKSIPEKEIRAYYDKGLSPLLAMECAIANHKKDPA